MALPTAGWAGLAVGGAEVAGNGYVRLPVTFVPSGAVMVNTETLAWPSARPNGWGTIDTVQLWEDATGGERPLSTAILDAPVPVGIYVAPRISSGHWTLFVGPNVGSPYGMGRFGRGRYARIASVGSDAILSITFDPTDPCIDGAWEPLEPCVAGFDSFYTPCAQGAWEPLEAAGVGFGTPYAPCTPGVWRSA